jgi:HAD superfamily hydrolase (TIGR01509 family)
MNGPGPVAPTIELAERLTFPTNVVALLFDMDGVLIDTLAQDYALMRPLLAPYCDEDFTVPDNLVRKSFALSIDDFWPKLLADLGITLPPEALADLVERHERLREETAPTVHEGVVDILSAADELGLLRAVVSNNPGADVVRMLTAVGLSTYFDAVVGNDLPGLARKPSPDPYLAAARQLEVAPGDCVAIEDSVLGLESASRAGCYVVGVATGADTLEALSSSGYANRCYVDFRSGGRVGA